MTVKLRRTRTVAASVRTLLFRSFLMFLSAITIRPACASTLDDFTVAVEAAMADGRVASSYLRTGNLDLAGVEIDRMRKAWAAVVDKFVKDRPNAFKDANQFNVTMTNVSAAIVGASVMLSSNHPDQARASLEKVRANLSTLRRGAGINVLPDCILDANRIMTKLLAYDKLDVDVNDMTVRDDIQKQADAYATLMKTCDGLASSKIHDDPQFRRLIDGADASLKNIKRALDERDAGLLHRVFDELRAIDNLLAFSVG
jgi:hypothetical protein